MEFDRIYTAGNAHGFTNGFRPDSDQWRWERNDDLAQFALEKNIAYHAVQLIYKTEVSWANGLDSQNAETAMELHIKEIISHYQNDFGNLPIMFNVVNETISAAESQEYSPWVWYDALGEGYVATAFTLARSFSPEGKLYYNDNENGTFEKWATKWDRIQTLVQGLVDAEVPINGVGFQFHQAPDKWLAKRNPISKMSILSKSF